MPIANFFDFCYTIGMFIRQIRKTNGITKKQYTYLNLVESIRTEKGPRQRLVLNLGNLQIDRSQYKALARRIEDILTGNQSLFEINPQIERHARKAADQIFTKRAQEINRQAAEEDYQKVNTKSLAVSKLRSLGPEYVCHRVWQELGFNQVLKNNGVPSGTLPLLEALVVSRLIEPGSERRNERWAEEESALYELCDLPKGRSLQSYYRGADVLYRCKEALEQHLSHREKELFNLDESIVLYDLTNTYFEGQCSRNPSAAYGRSKEKRSDCNLATMGLIVDGDGFAKYSKLYPGNQYEAHTFQEIISEMESHLTPENGPTIVMDAGIAEEANVAWLKEKGYRYIVVNRGKTPSEMNTRDMEVIREDKKKDIKIEARRYNGEKEQYVLIKSERKRKKEASMVTRVEQLLLDRLKYYKAGLNKKYHIKSYTKVLEKVGQLKAKYAKVAKLYEITVLPQERTGKGVINAIDIQWTKKIPKHDEATMFQGTYVLRTNHDELSNKQIWQTYLMLGRIETAFRNMKSHLGLRPNFHQLESRVNAHMFISVLAYHVMQAIEHKLRIAGDNRSWWTIKSKLSTHQRVTIEYDSKEEDGVYHNKLRVNSQLESSHLEIYTNLKLSGNPLNRRLLSHKICSVKKNE